MLLALTIVVPLKRLGRAASSALGSGGAVTFPESRRSDEIGDLQRSLRGLLLRLDERIRQTERFAADAAHEFRNPLAAIRSAAELAEGAADPADRARFYRAIVEDSERMRAITEGLRRLSLVEGGADPAARELVDLALAAGTACARAQAALDRGGGDVAFVVEEGKPGVKVSVDPAAFDVILDNLIGNAFSFAKSRVEVTIAYDEARRRAAIAIEDDGPGIPSEHLGRVFDRFFTYRPGELRGNHTGLGLSLALALAHSQGGELEASNSPAGGALFLLSLPASLG
jgi:two-component system sensor histidine kinase MtrB